MKNYGHSKYCNWVKFGCSWIETHEYCPHDEHKCDCQPNEIKKLDNTRYSKLLELLFELSKDMTRICLENGAGKGIDYYADKIEKLYVSLE